MWLTCKKLYRFKAYNSVLLGIHMYLWPSPPSKPSADFIQVECQSEPQVFGYQNDVRIRMAVTIGKYFRGWERKSERVGSLLGLILETGSYISASIQRKLFRNRLSLKSFDLVGTKLMPRCSSIQYGHGSLKNQSQFFPSSETSMRKTDPADLRLLWVWRNISSCFISECYTSVLDSTLYSCVYSLIHRTSHIMELVCIEHNCK